MDTISLVSEPITHHADSYGGFYTTSLFWDCSCEERYIHAYTRPDCPACGDRREDAPDARVFEVFHNALEWHLDQALIRQLEEVFPCSDLDIEPDDGLLVEQYENASRVHDDDWLEAAYEDRICGLNDDF
jgi:hypothetical protein